MPGPSEPFGISGNPKVGLQGFPSWGRLKTVPEGQGADISVGLSAEAAPTFRTGERTDRDRRVFSPACNGAPFFDLVTLGTRRTAVFGTSPTLSGGAPRRSDDRIARPVFRLGMVAFLAIAFVPRPADASEAGSETATDPVPVTSVLRSEAEGAEVGTSDPLETVNRRVSSFNRRIRRSVLDPVIDAYQRITPDVVEVSISNVLSNLGEPMTIVNSLAQGDLDNAGVSTTRLAINTTVGIAGIRDQATDMGYVKRREDLGQTLGVYGIGPGPHVVLPVLGPTNLRDGLAGAVQTIVNPVPLADGPLDRAVAYSNAQDAIDALTKGALDPYVVEKESYEQHRRFAIQNGTRAQPEDFPTLSAD